MQEQETISIRQIPNSPLPPPPASATSALTADHWNILLAVADTVVPSLSPEGGNRLLQHPIRREVYEASCTRLSRDLGDGQRDVVETYLAEKASAQANFLEGIRNVVDRYMPEDARSSLAGILKALNSRPGALLLTGYSTPLDCLPIQDRENILLGWSQSRIPLFRQIFRGLTSLIKVLWIRTSPSLGQVLGFPRTPVQDKPPGSFYPFEFLQIPPSKTHEPEIIEADAVIVGSGCGGAVVAKTLSEAGMKVIVVDKSYYWPPAHLPMNEYEACGHMFANGLFLQNDDQDLAVAAGSVWGGGGTVNWSASLQLQGIVRREWSDKFGLKYFGTSAFQKDMDAVCERMGVGTDAIEHNEGNRVLLEGARKLGWNAKTVPNNTGGEAHNCGYCTYGCGSCGKKGPTETFLPDAARAGARFVEGFEVSEILFETGAGGKKTATGVRGIWTSRNSNGGVADPSKQTRRPVIIKAPRTIISAGAIESPLVLLRSGLTNPHIGRHLHLHPATHIGAVWDHDVRPWEGPILTSVVNEFDNLDGEGYGVKLECNIMVPGMWLPMVPWRGGREWKEFAASMRRHTGYFSMARDRYGGRVYLDPKGGKMPRLQYRLSKYDRAHLLEGLVRMAELLYVQGAREIHVTAIEPFIRPTAAPEANISVAAIEDPSVDDEAFQAWLKKLWANGMSDAPALASAHQMGSCRMGVDQRTSVVDAKGRVWGTKGLWVADASVFPSASGVNPMVTNMGLSRGIARGIVAEHELGRRGARPKL